MKHSYLRFLCTFASLLGVASSQAQEPEIFTRGDFELQGPVKSCVIKANYGEEHFEFDREGRLLKSLTRFNEADYDITHYIYDGPFLKERRDEVYRNKAFDQQTSIAHFYQRDTAAHRLLERIVSYDRNFQEQVALEYDSIGRLQRIVRTDSEGVDETRVEYSSFREEATTNYLLGGVVQKSVRTSHQGQGNQLLTIELTREYLQGQPQRAVEKTSDARGRVLGETLFAYDSEKNTFRPTRTTRYTYNEDGLLQEETTRQGGKGDGVTRKYVYQMDGADPPNWIRQVVTPDNTIVVRQIAYFKPRVPGQPADSIRN